MVTTTPSLQQILEKGTITPTGSSPSNKPAIPSSTPTSNTPATTPSLSQILAKASSTTPPPTQPLAQAIPSTKTGTMNKTGSGVLPAPNPGIGTAVQNIEKLPSEAMDIANKVTGPGTGFNTAVQDLGTYEADLAHPELASEEAASGKPGPLSMPSLPKAALGGVELAQAIPESAAADKVGSVISDSFASRATRKIVQALTPRLTPGQAGSEISDAARAGKIFDPSSLDSVKKSASAIQDVASRLGKNASDIVKSGVKQAKNNAARIGQTIQDYARDVVTPFIKKSSVNYNFADLADSLKLIKPSSELKGEALATYNSVRDQILDAVSKKVSPSVTGGKNLAELRGMATDGTIPQKVSEGDKDFWDGRKIIDEIGDSETNGKIFKSDAYNGASTAWKDMRAGFKQYLTDAYMYPGQMEKVNSANDFLSQQRVKAMDKTGWVIDDFEKQFGLQKSADSVANAGEWEKHMDNMSSLYDAIENVTTQAKAQEGKTARALFAKAHPIITKGAGVAGAAALAGVVGEGSVDIVKKIGL